MGPGPGKEDDTLMWAINKSSIRMGDTQAYCWCRNLVKVTIYRNLVLGPGAEILRFSTNRGD